MLGLGVDLGTLFSGGRGVSQPLLKSRYFPPGPPKSYGPSYGVSRDQTPRSLPDVGQFTTLCCRVGYTGETNFRAQRHYTETAGVYWGWSSGEHNGNLDVRIDDSLYRRVQRQHFPGSCGRSLPGSVIRKLLNCGPAKACQYPASPMRIGPASIAIDRSWLRGDGFYKGAAACHGKHWRVCS